jgi:hypothetical protein
MSGGPHGELRCVRGSAEAVRPVLGGVIDAHHFDGFDFQSIHNDVRRRRGYQLAGVFQPSRAAVALLGLDQRARCSRSSAALSIRPHRARRASQAVEPADVDSL